MLLEFGHSLLLRLKIRVKDSDSPALTQHPRLLRNVVRTDFPTITPGLRSEDADMFELLGKIEQHVRSDNVRPDGFFLPS